MTRPSPTPQRPYRAARAGRGPLAALVGFLLVLAGIVVGAVPAAAHNRVGASSPASASTVGSSAGIGAGQRLGKVPPRPQIVVATGVAAEPVGVGSDLVRYDPEVASRNLLNQVGDGYAVTPGGRTVSAHAADRVVNGAPGRGPTTLGTVDNILDSASRFKYDPIRDTVKVKATASRTWLSPERVARNTSSR
jgi:hypothetical protein